VTAVELYDAVAALRRAAVAGHITRQEYDERARQLLLRRAATVAIRRTSRQGYDRWLQQRRAYARAYRARRRGQQ
jgi:hypothetical protein